MHRLIAAILVSLSTGAVAQQVAPNVLVDEGACPFECCQYGPWTTTKSVPAFSSPSHTAKPAALIAPGTAVTAVTGQVVTQGKKFVVTRAHQQYKPGDVLVVYTYLGEGHFTVWHKGQRFTEHLGFSPYSGSSGEQCTDTKYCWGTLLDKLQSQWWVKVRLHTGQILWVHGDDSFQGQDACN